MTDEALRQELEARLSKARLTRTFGIEMWGESQRGVFDEDVSFLEQVAIRLGRADAMRNNDLADLTVQLEILRAYVRHHEWCASLRPPTRYHDDPALRGVQPCDCGLAAVLQTESEKKKENPT